MSEPYVPHYKITRNPLTCSSCGAPICRIEPYAIRDSEDENEILGYGLINVSNVTGKTCCSFDENSFNTREEAQEVADDTFKLWKSEHRIWRAQQRKEKAEISLYQAEQSKKKLSEKFKRKQARKLKS